MEQVRGRSWRILTLALVALGYSAAFADNDNSVSFGSPLLSTNNQFLSFQWTTTNNGNGQPFAAKERRLNYLVMEDMESREQSYLVVPDSFCQVSRPSVGVSPLYGGRIRYMVGSLEPVDDHHMHRYHSKEDVVMACGSRTITYDYDDNRDFPRIGSVESVLDSNYYYDVVMVEDLWLERSTGLPLSQTDFIDCLNNMQSVWLLWDYVTTITPNFYLADLEFIAGGEPPIPYSMVPPFCLVRGWQMYEDTIVVEVSNFANVEPLVVIDGVELAKDSVRADVSSDGKGVVEFKPPAHQAGHVEVTVCAAETLCTKLPWKFRYFKLGEDLSEFESSTEPWNDEDGETDDSSASDERDDDDTFTHTHVFAWGSNHFGELGIGTVDDSEIPREIILSMEDPLNPTQTIRPAIREIMTGKFHSLVRAEMGYLFAWGQNHYGQLGMGDRVDRPGPQKVEGMRVSHIAVGTFHSLAISIFQDVVATGKNYYGELGLGDEVHRDTFTEIPSLSAGALNATVVQVAAGEFHSVALDDLGRVYTWGWNQVGQLGLGDDTTRHYPERVQLLGDAHIEQIAAGNFHTFALASNGTLFSWGANGAGQLGVGHFDHSATPTIVSHIPSGNSRIQSVVTGGFNSFVLLEDGRVFAWGGNAGHELAMEHYEPSHTPIEVAALRDYTVRALVAGEYHAIAIVDNGIVVSWGSNWHGQLGRKTSETDTAVPAVVEGLELTDRNGEKFPAEALSLGAGKYQSFVAVDPQYHWPRNMPCEAEDEWPAATGGERVFVPCPDSYVGNISRLCLEDGRWGYIDFISCKAMKCPEDGEWPVVNAGETWSIFCPQGKVGRVARTCNGNGHWTEPDTSQCRDVKFCPEEEGWPETAGGRTLSTYCPRGMSGTRKRKCDSAGQWEEADEADCEQLYCGDDGQWKKTKAGRTAVISCPVGSIGNSTRRCSYDGVWQTPNDIPCVVDPSPICPEMNEWPMTRSRQRATQPCAPGYSGYRHRYCNSDGYWEGVDESQCLIINGCPTEDPWPQTPSGYLATIECPDGYDGPRTRACSLNGEWEDENLDQCRLKFVECDCDGRWPKTLAGETAVLDCAISGVEKRHCFEGGVWGAVNSSNCSQSRGACPKADNWPPTPSGFKVSQSCPNGASGTVTRICSQTGTWEDVVEHCWGCQAGYYIPSGETVESCQPCPAGAFSSSVSSTECTLCPRNTYTDSVGSVACNPCPSGQYAAAGASSCVDTPPDDNSSGLRFFASQIHDNDVDVQHQLPHEATSDGTLEELSLRDVWGAVVGVVSMLGLAVALAVVKRRWQSLESHGVNRITV